MKSTPKKNHYSIGRSSHLCHIKNFKMQKRWLLNFQNYLNVISGWSSLTYLVCRRCRSRRRASGSRDTNRFLRGECRLLPDLFITKLKPKTQVQDHRKEGRGATLWVLVVICKRGDLEEDSLVDILDNGAVDEDAEAVLPLGEPDGPRQVLGPRRALCHAEQVPLVNHNACIE